MAKRLFTSVLVMSVVTAALLADANHPTGTTFKERSSIKVATNPHDFALSADRKTAYVPLYGDGIYGRNPNPGHEVLIVDMEAAKVVGSIDVSPYRAPHGIQIDNNGMLYVTSDLDRKLLVLDPKARKMTKAIETEGTTHWIGILPNGSKIYATNKSDPPFVRNADLARKRWSALKALHLAGKQLDAEVKAAIEQLPEVGSVVRTPAVLLNIYCSVSCAGHALARD